MNFEDKVSLIKTIPLFSYFEESQVREFLNSCQECHLQKGEILFEEGSEADHMFVVLAGKIEIFKPNQILDNRVPGEFFGEMGILDPAPRAAGARAKSPSLLLKIDKTVFKKFFISNGEIISELIKTIIHRARGDISNLEIGYKKLKREKNVSTYLRHILNDSSNEIYVFSLEDLKISQMNSRALAKLCLKAEDLKQITPLEFIEGMDESTLENLLRPLMDQKQTVIKKEFHHKTSQGNFYPVETRFQLLNQDESEDVVAIVDDISERIAFEDQLERMAYFDPVTDLPNRNGLEREINQWRIEKKNRPAAMGLLLIQINKYKEIHETLGEAGTNQLVVAIAERFHKILPEGSVLARVAPDEFGVLLGTEADRTALEQFAPKIIHLFRKTVSAFNLEIHLTVNIGCCYYPAKGQPFNELIQHLQLALSASIARGENQIEFYQDRLKEKADERFHLINDLSKALDEDQLFLVFQPKVSLVTGRIEAVEALIRWKHPKTGLISPGVFIPLAEESFLIVRLGNWVLKNTCLALKQWVNSGLNPIHFSLNISGVQFAEENFIEELSAVIQEAEVDPEKIELELTESILVENINQVIEDLHRIQQLGVQVSIDDFGTGYSSLKYLTTLPLDTLKVDKSFVDGIHQQEKSMMVDFIVRLGQALDKKIVAEGVEENYQKEYLKTLGCDLIQGYLYSKPLTYDELVAFHKKVEETPFSV